MHNDLETHLNGVRRRNPERGRVAALIVVTLLGLAACSPSELPAPAAPESAAAASSRLDALIQRYADSQASGGFSRNELRAVTAESFLSEIAAKQALLEDVEAVAPEGLSPDASIDRRFLIGLLESDIYTAERRRLWENDASMYVPAGAIGRLLEPQAEEPVEERAASLLAVLKDIPNRLDIARENLKNPPPRFTESAVFKTQGTIASLETDGASLAGAASVSEDEYAATLETAVAALKSFERFLEDELLPRSTGSWAIGKEHYDFILQRRWFFDQDAPQILERGWRAFEETEALAQEVAERIDPGKHWSEVYEQLKDNHPPADGIKAAYQEWMDAAQVFVRDKQILMLPEGERVITVDTPPAMRRSSPFGTFQTVDRFGTDLEGKLVLTPIESWMTPEQQAERLRSHHWAWVPVIAVHEAYPGHHADAIKTRENPRLLRKIARESIFSEGWGLMTEELMFELGFLKGDDVRLTQRRNRLWRAARVILDVSLHTGEMTVDEAVDFMVERVRFEHYAAQLEVGMYTVRPTYVLGYLIGMEEIMRIRSDWIAANGEPEPPSEFYDQLLTVGSLPPVLVREALLGEE